MDKKSIIGFVLIFVVVVGWMYWQQATTPKPEKINLNKDTVASSRNNIPEKDTLAKIIENNQTNDSTAKLKNFGSKFVNFSEGNDRWITIENDVVKAVISTKGAVIKKWELKTYKKWDGTPSQLIRDFGGEYFLTFVTYEGVKIDSRKLFFNVEDNNNADSIRINGSQKYSLNFYVEPEPGRKIIKRFTFFGDKYSFDSEIITENMETIIPATRGYNLVWENGISYQEHNSVDESSDAHALAQLNGDVAELNADKDEPVESKETGIIDFIGIKSKYFGAAIIPEPWQSFDGTADLYGSKKLLKDNGIMEVYSMSFRVPIKEGVDKKKFKVYIGPLDYDIVSSYGINPMVNLGWKYGIRQIGEYFMLPIFNFIHKFVPNYGISIIIFSIIMKFLLYPLTIQQMRSAQKMQLLAPEMNKLREKYKDDNMKQQQETMKLYGEYGINPAGGCLPMLAQMPILIALWQLLRASIDLRQSEFFWWINDLSVPDSIVNFGFSFLGISHISGLALLMGITMFFQQKLTITDPRQKAMIYMMPVMFTLMFSNFPSGLNLYYFMFNLLSIGQQLYINKYSKNRPTLDDLRRAPKKQSWLQKKMQEAQQIAESQGRSVPGVKSSNSQSNGQKGNQQRKKK